MLDTDLALVRTLEECAFNAWPARQTLCHGGWLLRLSGGFTKRANSVNALAPVGDAAGFAGVRTAAEALYARQGLPAVFRLSPLAPPEADAGLAAAGYRYFDPSLVLTALLTAPQAAAEAHASVRVESAPTPAWLDGFAEANGVAPAHQATHHAMVQAIAPPAGFATLHDDAGQAVGFGLAVCERGWVGFYDVVVRPDARGRGLGRRLMRALLHWGREAGATQAYLQVRAQNEVAQKLYAALGFGELYRYHYRVPALPA